MLVLTAMLLLRAQAGVTFSAPADRLERLIPAIGKAAGLDLRASAGMANEVMLVSIKGRPTETVLKQIAATCDATWENKNETYWLTRTPEMIRKLRARELARRTEALRADQADHKRKFEQQPPFDESQAGKLADRIENWYKTHRLDEMGSMTNDQRVEMMRSWDAIVDSLPVAGVVSRIANSIDPAVFVSVTGNHRAVLSNRPTRIQRSLGPAGQAAVDEFMRIQNVWADMWKKRGEPFKMDRLWSADPREQRQYVKASDLRAEVVITPYIGLSTVWIVRLLITDSKKTYLASAHTAVGQMSLLEPPAAAPTSATEKPMTLTEKSKEAYAVFSRARLAEESRPPLTPQWKARLLDPATTDPLSWYLSEDILEALRETGKEVIGVIPDRASSAAGFLRFQKDTKPSDFLRSVARYGEADLTEQDGLIIIKPEDPLQTEAQRVNRKDLAAFERSVLDKGRVSIAGITALLANNSDMAYADLARAYANALVPGSIDGFDTPDFDLLRFYGHLSDPQRQILERGDGLPWMNLSGSQRAELEDMVFWKTHPPDMEKMDLDSDFKKLGRNSNEDVTDLVPDGLSSDTAIRLQETRETIIGTIFHDTAQRQYTHVQTVGALAVNAAMSVAAGGSTPEQYLDALIFLEGTRRNLNFTFELSQDVAMHRQLKETWFDSRKPVPFDSLPDKTRGRINAGIAAEMKRRQEFGTTPKRNPPPR